MTGSIKYLPRRVALSAVPVKFDFDYICNYLSAHAGRATGVEKFKTEYLLTELRGKYPLGSFSLPLADRQEAALKKLLDANAHCALINEIGYLTDEISPGTLSSIIQAAANKCRVILGDFSYNVYAKAKFTNGATTCRRFQHRDPYYKYSSRHPIDVSRGALSRMISLINATPLWCQAVEHDAVKINDCDKVTYVPKNATEERVIVPQQAGNVCLQSALGQHIRSRLKLTGIDLTDQTRNQALARVGSVSNSLATLDLKNASALMNYRIVWDLIPPIWFKELDALRNKYGKIDKANTIKWEMFSSMGNGYNFELESLVFYTLALAACEHLGDYIGDISVYGDDIIVPASCAEFVCSVLKATGFMINEKKSHIKGPFRESCGAHWYNGHNVKPFYIRKPVCNVKDIIRIGNRLREWASIDIDGVLICDPSFQKLWKQITDCVPQNIRGGVDLSVDYSLVDASPRKGKLVNIQNKKPARGWSSLLRYWQNQNHDSVDLLFCVYSGSQDSDNHSLIDVDEQHQLVKPNDDRLGRMAWFPDETKFLILSHCDKKLYSRKVERVYVNRSLLRCLQDPNYSELLEFEQNLSLINA